MKSFKCTVISDTHTFHPNCKLKGGDFLFHCGDLSWFGQQDEIEEFMDWFAKQPYRYKIFIAGNHDLGFEPLGYGRECTESRNSYIFRGREILKGLDGMYRSWADTRGLIYLDKEGITLEGIKIYGIPDQPAFCNWGFNYYTDKAAEAIFSKIPEGLDILITHGPANGILDNPSINSMLWGDNRLGCPILLKHIQRTKPKYHLCGHIHESYGRKKVGATTHINAAFCSIPYNIHNKPINFTLKLDK